MTWNRLTIAMALTLFTATAAVAQSKTPELATETPGLKVGEKAPDFELTDQAGKKQKLSTLLKEKNVAIVFYRSGSW